MSLRPDELPDRNRITPESAFTQRRQFLKQLGLGSVALAAGGCFSGARSSAGPAVEPFAQTLETLSAWPEPVQRLYPAPANERFLLAGETVTEPPVPARYNNFYEFTTDKERVWQLAQDLDIRPWELKVDGLVRKPLRFDVDELVQRFSLEERIYRHRCVEAWAMVVPWTGFPLADLIRAADPLPQATHVRFVSFNRPSQARGQRTDTHYPWPYYEGLTLAEALHPLTLVGTGVYGKPLPKQNGAPVRIVVPWKYGYKSPKSIVRIELVAAQPGTFWNDLQPLEYSFLSNVNPEVPHPRWSQRTERLIDTGERVPTRPYNGYGRWVADLYA